MKSTDKNFRLSKATKAALEMIPDRQRRNEWLKLMVDAEHTAEVNKKKSLRQREKSDLE